MSAPETIRAIDCSNALLKESLTVISTGDTTVWLYLSMFILKIAEDILRYVGGRENVRECAAGQIEDVYAADTGHCRFRPVKGLLTAAKVLLPVGLNDVAELNIITLYKFTNKYCNFITYVILYQYKRFENNYLYIMT